MFLSVCSVWAKRVFRVGTGIIRVSAPVSTARHRLLVSDMWSHGMLAVGPSMPTVCWPWRLSTAVGGLCDGLCIPAPVGS